MTDSPEFPDPVTYILRGKKVSTGIKYITRDGMFSCTICVNWRQAWGKRQQQDHSRGKVGPNGAEDMDDEPPPEFGKEGTGFPSDLWN